MDRDDKARWKEAAKLDGVSLSAWVRSRLNRSARKELKAAATS